MKALFLTIAISTLSLFTIAQNTLTVNIVGLKTSEGTVNVQLYDANEQVIKEASGTVNSQKCTVEFTDLPAGTYAVQYFHDENDNGKMDTGTFGIPEEGYGYSNDARGFMGPADFKDQIFELKSSKSITLITVL